MVVCKMRLPLKNALLHKLGFVQPPTFILPGLRSSVMLATDLADR